MMKRAIDLIVDILYTFFYLFVGYGLMSLASVFISANEMLLILAISIVTVLYKKIDWDKPIK